MRGVWNRPIGRLGLGLLLIVFGPVWAAEYYVDQGHPRASDDNPGSEQRPWATLQRAARAPLKPGDTVYVKAGHYDVRSGGAWNRPAVNIPGGAPGKPVTFKSLPAHAAVLQASPANPAIGVNGNSHVVIDGFVIPKSGPKGIAVFGEPSAPVRDVVIRNNIIHGIYLDGVDNAEAIRIENAREVLVRNNRIYDVRNGGGSSNASAVKTYNTQDVTVEHNEIFDVIAGIKEKYRSTGLTIRNNLLRDCRYGFVLNTQRDGVTRDIRIYQNVVACDSGFRTTTQPGTELREVHIYNNTFVGYREQAWEGSEHGRGLYIYNNIFYRPGPIAPADFLTRQPDTAEIRRMDYNLFLQEPKAIVGLYTRNDTFTSLASWRRGQRGLSQHDLVGDPRFVDPERGDYRLKPDSPAIGLGREGGVPDGRPVNAGAYPTGSEVIGLIGPPWQ